MRGHAQGLDYIGHRAKHGLNVAGQRLDDLRIGQLLRA